MLNIIPLNGMNLKKNFHGFLQFWSLCDTVEVITNPFLFDSQTVLKIIALFSFD